MLFRKLLVGRASFIICPKYGADERVPKDSRAQKRGKREINLICRHAEFDGNKTKCTVNASKGD